MKLYVVSYRMNYLLNSFQHFDNVWNKNAKDFSLTFVYSPFPRNVSYLSTWNLKPNQMTVLGTTFRCSSNSKIETRLESKNFGKEIHSFLDRTHRKLKAKKKQITRRHPCQIKELAPTQIPTLKWILFVTGNGRWRRSQQLYVCITELYELWCRSNLTRT